MLGPGREPVGLTFNLDIVLIKNSKDSTWIEEQGRTFFIEVRNELKTIRKQKAASSAKYSERV